MSNLKLITTETFNNLPCNFYEKGIDMNKNIYAIALVKKGLLHNKYFILAHVTKRSL